MPCVLHRAAPHRGSATGRGRRRRAAIAVAAAGLAVGVAACAPGPPQPAPPALGSQRAVRAHRRPAHEPRPAGQPRLRGLPDRRGGHAEPGRDLRRRRPPGRLPGPRVPGQLQRPLRGRSSTTSPGPGTSWSWPPTAAATWPTSRARRTSRSPPRRRRAAARAGRPANVGLIGHSLGGGMLPYVTQQVAARGWGTDGLWLFSLAPYQGIGSGPISLPAHTRAVIEAYDQDALVNRSVGVDLFRRMSMPASQKDHVTVRTLEPRRRSAHRAAHVAQLDHLARRRREVLRHLPRRRHPRELRPDGPELHRRHEPRWATGPTAPRRWPRSSPTTRSGGRSAPQQGELVANGGGDALLVAGGEQVEQGARAARPAPACARRRPSRLEPAGGCGSSTPASRPRSRAKPAHGPSGLDQRAGVGLHPQDAAAPGVRRRPATPTPASPPGAEIARRASVEQLELVRTGPRQQRPDQPVLAVRTGRAAPAGWSRSRPASGRSDRSPRPFAST